MHTCVYKNVCTTALWLCVHESTCAHVHACLQEPSVCACMRVRELS